MNKIAERVANKHLTARTKRVIVEVVVSVDVPDDDTFPIAENAEEAVYDAVIRGTRRMQKMYNVSPQGLGQSKVK